MPDWRIEVDRWWADVLGVPAAAVRAGGVFAVGHADHVGVVAVDGGAAPIVYGPSRLLPVLRAAARAGHGNLAAGPYLAAAAFTGASEGLRAAHELLEWLSPDVLQEGLCLVAEAAVHQGCAPAIARLAAGESDITVQAAWVEAAARSHAVEPGTLISLIRELGPRVTDELDPGRHLLAGLPLLAALAAAGSDEDLARLGVEWRVPPPLLADQLFYRGLAAGPAVFERLLDVPEPDWDDLFEYDFCWWKPVSRDPAARVQACANVVAIGANLPWRPMPGSLKDLVHWP